MTDYSQKLTEEQVTALRRRHWVGGVIQADLAEQFGISASQVSQIIRRKSWPFLPKVVNET
jgi:uncharacterized protein YjcR